MSVLDFPTLHAHHLIDLYTTENVLEKVLSRCVKERVFDPIEKNIQELLSILLFADLRWTAIKLFKGEAKTRWIVELPLWEFKISK